MLPSITPVILTLDEAPNIARTLAALAWAPEVVVVDSFSSDDTERIAKAFPNVRFVKRHFDSHAAQWNFAIDETGIESAWILALDADYVLTPGLVDELRALDPHSDLAGQWAQFEYCMFGKPLRGSVYPPVIALFRKGCGKYRQDGHTQRLELRGATAELARRIKHDDRKPVSRWIASQNRYMD